MRKHLRPATAALIAFGLVMQALPAQGRPVCVIFDLPFGCDTNCKVFQRQQSAEDLRVDLQGMARLLSQTLPKDLPDKITSCKISASPKQSGWCRITACGPKEGPFVPRRPLPAVKQPTPKPKVGPPSPAASEKTGGSAIDRLSGSPASRPGAGGSGSAERARKSGGGSAAQGGGSAGSGAAGGAAGVSTFKSPSNVVAPPAGSGLR
jgi:hypothetical protein